MVPVHVPFGIVATLEEYKSNFATAKITSENGIFYLDVVFDIDKLKKEYPFGLPSTVTTHVPFGIVATLLDEEPLSIMKGIKK